MEGVAPARCTPYLSCLYLYAPVLLCFSLSLSLSLSLSALNLSLLVFPSLSLYLPLSLSLSRPLPLFDLLFKQSRLHCLDVGLTWYLWHIKLRWQYIHHQWRRHLVRCHTRLAVYTFVPLCPYQQFPRIRYVSQVSVIIFVELAGSSRSLPTR